MNCRRRFLILVVILILAVPVIRAADGNKESDYHGITEKFFAMLSAGKASEAVEYVFGLNPYTARKPDEIAKVKSQVTAMTAILGNYEGHEILLEKPLGSRFVNLTYLAFYDRQPIRLNFQFYQVKDAWLTYSFDFEDRFAAELAESGKDESLRSPECRKK